MSRVFVLALIVLGICLTSTSEAQLFRRGIFRARTAPNYYAQPANRQRITQNNTYAVPMTDRYGRRYYQYYRRPSPSNQATNPRSASNEYARRMYGQKSPNVSRIPTPAARQNVNQPMNQPLVRQAQGAVPVQVRPSNQSVIRQGIYNGGPQIIGPVVLEAPLPTGLPPSSAVVPPSAVPTEAKDDPPAGSFSILEKSDGG